MFDIKKLIGLAAPFLGFGPGSALAKKFFSGSSEQRLKAKGFYHKSDGFEYNSHPKDRWFHYTEPLEEFDY